MDVKSWIKKKKQTFDTGISHAIILSSAAVFSEVFETTSTHDTRHMLNVQKLTSAFRWTAFSPMWKYYLSPLLLKTPIVLDVIKHDVILLWPHHWCGMMNHALIHGFSHLKLLLETLNFHNDGTNRNDVAIVCSTKSPPHKKWTNESLKKKTDVNSVIENLRWDWSYFRNLANNNAQKFVMRSTLRANVKSVEESTLIVPCIFNALLTAFYCGKIIFKQGGHLSFYFWDYAVYTVVSSTNAMTSNILCSIW